ncbi:hypothetical protein L3C95_30610 [Chitinophaga filiformis]|uniref:hypothetical protein n=1 Tax=Chitinophaga filiformis TaxID=104663 RepID=UPI001F3FCE8E|nr:hypothetical protein [Chitinophaga filiformis]MCF6407286.1 hypothetical protein [Chitinophaga filiformis]
MNIRSIPVPLVLLLLLTACKKDSPASPEQNTKDSIAIISNALYYPTGDTSAAPDIISINYNADHRIEKISQAYHSLPDTVSWTFAYNTDGTIASVKGSRLYWDTKQDYYFYYTTSGRLDSISTNDVAYGGDSIRVNNVFSYDANNHIKSSYSYVSDGGTATGLYTGDTLAKVTFFRSAGLDSVSIISYNHTHINSTPPVSYVTSTRGAAHFNKGAFVDLSTLDKSFLFWLSIRNRVHAPMNYFNPFWYQYINPDIAMATGGTFSETPGSWRAYDFNATKNEHGSINAVSLIDAGNSYSDAFKIAYIRIPE